ncbi:hypothetical protein ACROYT_G015422 [Oculina patagonica]
MGKLETHERTAKGKQAADIAAGVRLVENLQVRCSPVEDGQAGDLLMKAPVIVKPHVCGGKLVCIHTIKLRSGIEWCNNTKESAHDWSKKEFE